MIFTSTIYTFAAYATVADFSCGSFHFVEVPALFVAYSYVMSAAKVSNVNDRKLCC